MFALLARGSGFVQALLVCSALAAAALLSYILASGIPFVRSLAELVLFPLRLSTSYLGNALSNVGNFVRLPLSKLYYGKKHAHESVAPAASVILGLFLGIPAVGVLLILFSASDPIFSKTAQEFFSKITVTELLIRIVVSIIVASILVPLSGMTIGKEFRSPVNILYGMSFVHTMATVMVMIAITTAVCF